MRKLAIMFKSRPLLAVMLVLVSVLLIAGTVFAVTVSNLWVSPNITVTAPPIIPPSNLPLVLSSPDFTSDRTIQTETISAMSVNLSNPSPAGAPGYPAVLVQFTINKTGIAVSDVKLEYQVLPATDWYELTLVDNGDVLTGTFGPAGGFPVGNAYNVTTPIRAMFYTVGVYYATANVVTVP